MNQHSISPKIILHLNDSDLSSCLQVVQTALKASGRIKAVLVVGENLPICQKLAQAWSFAVPNSSATSEVRGLVEKPANPGNTLKDRKDVGASVQGSTGVSPVGAIERGIYAASVQGKVREVPKPKTKNRAPSPQSPVSESAKVVWMQTSEENIPTIQTAFLAGVEASLLVLSADFNLWIQIEANSESVSEEPSWQVSLLFEPTEIAELLRKPEVSAVIPQCSELSVQDLGNNSSKLKKLWLQLLALFQPDATGMAMRNEEWEEQEKGKLTDYQLPISEPPKSKTESSKFEEVLFWESPLGIFYESLDGCIERANPAMTKLIGYTESQLRRLDCRAISHPEDFPTEVKAIEQLINGGLQRQTIEKRFISRNGTIVWAEVTISLLGDPMAEDSYLAVFVKDLSYIRRAEEEIQQRRERELLLNEIAATIRSTFDFSKILEIGVRRLQEALNTDRVVAYQFQPDFSGICAAEAVKPAYPAIKGQSFPAECIPEPYLQAYCQGRLWYVADVQNENLSECHLQMLARIKVRSTIAAAIQSRSNALNPSQGKLWGLLVVHSCRAPRQWLEDEAELVQGIANQMAIAFEQASLVGQLKAYTHELEERVKERTVTLLRSLQFEQLIRNLTETLRQDLNEDQMLQAAVEGLVENLGVDGCYAMLFEPQEKVLQVRYEYIKNEPLDRASVDRSKPPLRLPLKELPELCRTSLIAGKTCSTGEEPCLISYGEGEDRAKKKQENCPFLTSHCQFSLCNSQFVKMSPIFDAQGLIGAICVFQPQPRQFKSDEIQLLEQVASQCAIAIRQSRTWRQLQQQNQELATINRVKGELIANTSHELRTPLTAILGFSNVLMQECFGQLNPKQKQYVERITNSGQHLLELINDILDLSRIEAGRLDLEMQVVFIAEIVDSAINLIRDLAIARGLSVEVEVAPDLEYLTADSRRVKQILVNLLGNAIKFTQKGSVGLKVYRSCQTVDDATVETIDFQVWDTGIGIDPSEQGRLFSPFSQIDSSLSRQYPGTGLGLAIARKLAELHGGCITLESTRQKGSSFTLQLPVYSSPQALQV